MIRPHQAALRPSTRTRTHTQPRRPIATPLGCRARSLRRSDPSTASGALDDAEQHRLAGDDGRAAGSVLSAVMGWRHRHGDTFSEPSRHELLLWHEWARLHGAGSVALEQLTREVAADRGMVRSCSARQHATHRVRVAHHAEAWRFFRWCGRVSDALPRHRSRHRRQDDHGCLTHRS